MKRVALGLLTNHGKLLLYLRDDKPGIAYPNFYSLLGGTIESDETPESALRREIKEETGCEVGPLSFIGELDVSNDPLCDDHTIYLFKGDVNWRLEDIILTEGQGIGYFTIGEFLALRFPTPLRTFILERRHLSDG